VWREVEVRAVIARFRRDWGGRDGQVLAIVALAMMTLIGITGLAIDVGILMSNRRELVAMTDAAALAAAGALSGPPSESDAARQARATARAQEYVLMHGFDPSAPGNTLTITFPVSSPARKLVQIETSRTVPLVFLRLFGFREATVGSGGCTGEAAPVDVVIVEDVSVSQLIGNYSMSNLDELVNPNYTGLRDPGSSIPSADKRAPYHYDADQKTTGYDWPPKATPTPYYRTNVPWKPFADQQDAARFFIGKLDSRYDQVGIVSFSTASSCGPYPSYTSPARVHQTLTNQFNLALDAVGNSPQTIGQKGKKGLYPCGGTSLAAGIQVGITVLTSFPPARDTAVGAMILLTDGSATNRLDGSRPSGCDSQHLNMCVDCRGDAMAQARIAASKGIVIYTIFSGSSQWGINEADNALLMQWIADLTDNRRLDGDYTGSRNLPTGRGPSYDASWFRDHVSENYYLATNRTDLEAAYASIFEKIYTRLVE